MTPPGIELATSRLVAQCLSKLLHRVPHLQETSTEILPVISVLSSLLPTDLSLDCLAPEDGIDRLSRNVGKLLTVNGA